MAFFPINPSIIVRIKTLIITHSIVVKLNVFLVINVIIPYTVSIIKRFNTKNAFAAFIALISGHFIHNFQNRAALFNNTLTNKAANLSAVKNRQLNHNVFPYFNIKPKIDLIIFSFKFTLGSCVIL